MKKTISEIEAALTALQAELEEARKEADKEFEKNTAEWKAAAEKEWDAVVSKAAEIKEGIEKAMNSVDNTVATVRFNVSNKAAAAKSDVAKKVAALKLNIKKGTDAAKAEEREVAAWTEAVTEMLKGEAELQAALGMAEAKEAVEEKKLGAEKELAKLKASAKNAVESGKEFFEKAHKRIKGEKEEEEAPDMYELELVVDWKIAVDADIVEYVVSGLAEAVNELIEELPYDVTVVVD